MNIFYLDTDPTTCAALHCDKHVVKMILEYGQLLSTAHHVLGSDLDLSVIYKEAYTNHPSAVWVRQHPDNYRWLYALFLAVLDEYTHRYGKVHAATRISLALSYLPNFPEGRLPSPPPQCMPDEYRHHDDVTAYRKYYALGKWQLLKYTKRPVPEWAKGSYIWKD